MQGTKAWRINRRLCVLLVLLGLLGRCELARSPVPRTWVNKGKKRKGPGQGRGNNLVFYRGKNFTKVVVIVRI